MTGPRAAIAIQSKREDHLGASSYAEKGWHHIALGDFVAAEAALREAARLAPSDSRVRSLLGWALMRQGRLGEAMEILEDVVAREPMNGLARASIGYVLIRKNLLREAHEQLSGAEAQMRDPQAALYACFYLGLLFGRQGDVVEAERYFRKTLSLAPNFIEAYYELGRVFRAAGDILQAENVWRGGNSANRFSVWGKRCAEAIVHSRAGTEPPSFS